MSPILIDVGVSSPALTREGGRSEGREGVFGNAARADPLVSGPFIEFFKVVDGVRSPVITGFGGDGATRGDSGRGRDGRRKRGFGIDGGPRDLLKLGVAAAERDGVGGVTGVLLVTYLELFIGTKIPAPGTDVMK